MGLIDRLNTLSQKILAICWLVMMSNLTHAQDEQTNDVDEPSMKPEATATPAAPREAVDVHKQQLDLLVSEVSKEDLQWLEAEGEKFLSLWQADKTGNPFGALLILHGEGQSADWPYEVNAIRNNLTHHGWATLAIDMPPAKAKVVPPRSPENGKTSMAKPAIHADPEKTSKARIASAIEFLMSNGQYNIVLVGHGVSAMRAAKYIDAASSGKNTMGSKIQRPIRALVIVDARNHLNEADDEITSFMNDSSLPVLDVYYGDHYLDQFNTKQRAKAVRSQGITHYYQVKMLRPTDAGEASENRLTRRVRGFLNKHAQGVEIDRKSGSKF